MFGSRVHTIPCTVRTEGIDILQGHMRVSLRSSFIRIRPAVTLRVRYIFVLTCRRAKMRSI